MTTDTQEAKKWNMAGATDVTPESVAASRKKAAEMLAKADALAIDHPEQN